MTQKNFTTAITVDQSPEQVFAAINDVRGWWSGELTGVTDRLGAEFTYAYKSFHRSTHTITELVPAKRVVWHTDDAHLSFVSDKSEWTGTDIEFDITRKGDKTELRFTHVGLVPALECYSGCSGAWRSLITEGLLNLITTGKYKRVVLDAPTGATA